MDHNIFYKKFQIKSDSELNQILTDKDRYTEQAINASIKILEERKSQVHDLNSENENIEPFEIKKEITEQQEVKEKKKNYLTEDPDAPELHSKRVIYVFATLFSSIFGAVLLMYNMKQTGNQKGRIQVLIFGILFTIASIVIIDKFKVNTNLALIFNIIGAVILNEYFWDKFIGKEFKYRKRSWVKPAIISVIIIIPFILAMFYGK